MISADVGCDGFIIWSIPHDAARTLVPAGLSPTRAEGRGWLALAAVELKHVRWFGCPVARHCSVAAWLVVIDVDGGARRANYFHALFSAAPLLTGMMRLAGARIRKAPVSVRREQRTLRIGIAGEIDAAIDLDSCVTPSQAHRLRELFLSNRSGVGQAHGGCFESLVTKDRWRMDPHAARIRHAPFLQGLEARLEFAFDASDVTASWAAPRRLAAGGFAHAAPGARDLR